MNQRPFLTAALFAALALACFSAPLLMRADGVSISATLPIEPPIEGLRGRFADVSAAFQKAVG